MPRLGVLGWPVAHSRSPAIQEAAFAATGLEGWTYSLLPVPPELLEETVRALPASGFVGANVTVPHKQAALALADDASVTATAIGAANTLLFQDGGLRAENTDAPGLLATLPFSPVDRRVLVLGAGGSARAAVWALIEAGAAEVMIWNRTRQRALLLAEDLGAIPVTRPPSADLLVNCTSVGLQGTGTTLKDLPLDTDELSGYRCVVDLVYGGGPTPLIEAARSRGLQVVDGLEVLVSQGALSFEAWTGQPAPIDAMRAAARAGS